MHFIFGWMCAASPPVTSSAVCVCVCSRFVAHNPILVCRMPCSYTLAVVLLSSVPDERKKEEKKMQRKRKRHSIFGFAYRVKISQRSVRSDSFSHRWKPRMAGRVVDVDGKRRTRNANNIAFLPLFTLANTLRWWSNVSTKNLYRRCSRITNLK